MTDSNYKQELERAKADALETAETLENLVQGIRAMKRILERPIDSISESESKTNCIGEASDIALVAKLSNKLVGVIGSELIGLLNASQMAKGHAKLRIEDDKKVIEELHTSKKVAHMLGERADKAKSMNIRLRAEKKVLVKEVLVLRENCQRLVKEVKSTRKMVERTKQFDSWRHLQNHLRDATMVHESVLNNKTFNTGFGGVDPPGTNVTKDINMEERNNDNGEHDFTSRSNSSISDEENNNGQLSYSPRVYSPRKEECEDDNDDRVLKYTNKPVACNSKSKSKRTPKPTTTPTSSKHRGLAFPKGIGKGISTSLDRFKNVLQEASDEMRGQQSRETSPRNIQKKTDESKNGNNDVSKTPTRNDNNSKSLDDEATKSTKSCSFEINNSLNLSTSMISCGDGDMSNDLALQISIDEGSSFYNTGCTIPLGDPSSPPTPLFMITPESVASSSSVGRSTKKCSKPICDPKVLRTLSIPNENRQRETTSETDTALKPRIRSLRVRSRS